MPLLMLYYVSAVVAAAMALRIRDHYLDGSFSLLKQDSFGPIVSKGMIYLEHVQANTTTLESVELLMDPSKVVWTEGPLVFTSSAKQKHFIFSDTELDRIFKYTEPIIEEEEERQSSRSLLELLSTFQQKKKSKAQPWMERAGGLLHNKQDNLMRSQLQEPGSNGLVLHPNKNIFLIFQHGTRRISYASTDLLREEKEDEYETSSMKPTSLVADGMTTTVLVDSFEGKKFHSPNDGVFTHDGSLLFFTDPPYGLRGAGTDLSQDQTFLNDIPSREHDYHGGVCMLPMIMTNQMMELNKEETGTLFRKNFTKQWNNRHLRLLIDDLPRPNGIALSSDKNVLFVSNSGHADPIKAKEYNDTVGGAFITAYNIIYEEVDLELPFLTGTDTATTTAATTTDPSTSTIATEDTTDTDAGESQRETNNIDNDSTTTTTTMPAEDDSNDDHHNDKENKFDDMNNNNSDNDRQQQGNNDSNTDKQQGGPQQSTTTTNRINNNKNETSDTSQQQQADGTSSAKTSSTKKVKVRIPIKAIHPQRIIDYSSHDQHAHLQRGPGSTDGIALAKVDEKCDRLYASGPGGIYVFDVTYTNVTTTNHDGSNEDVFINVTASHMESIVTETAIGNVVIDNNDDDAVLYVCADEYVFRFQQPKSP